MSNNYYIYFLENQVQHILAADQISYLHVSHLAEDMVRNILQSDQLNHLHGQLMDRDIFLK